MERMTTSSHLNSEFADLQRNADRRLDARGLNCPMPILKSKMQLRDMAPGATLYVQATDPHATIDFKAFCVRSGDHYLGDREQDGVFHIVLRKKPTA